MSNESSNLLTPVSRLSYPRFDKPQKASENAKAKYSCKLLWNLKDLSQKDKERHRALVQAAKTALREKFGNKAFDEDEKDGIAEGFKWPFRKEKKGEVLEGYQFIRANTERKPPLCIAKKVNGKLVFEDTDNHEAFYPGCRVIVTVRPYVFDLTENKGVAFGLQQVMFVGDDERIDGAAGSASEAFKDADIDEDELLFEEAVSDDDIEL